MELPHPCEYYGFRTNSAKSTCQIPKGKELLNDLSKIVDVKTSALVLDALKLVYFKQSDGTIEQDCVEYSMDTGVLTIRGEACSNADGGEFPPRGGSSPPALFTSWSPLEKLLRGLLGVSTFWGWRSLTGQKQKQKQPEEDKDPYWDYEY